jgi:hypothetical protein
MLARHEQSEARRAAFPAVQVERVTLYALTRAVAQQALEISLAPQAPLRTKAEALGCRGYNPRRRRPRARRLRSTARPPRVRLRTRNP